MRKSLFIVLLTILSVIAGAMFLFAPFHPKHYSGATQERYLSIVKPGLSIGDLKKAFGEPVVQREGPNGTVIFSYLASAPTMQDMGQENQFAGFEASVKDGVVVNSYITTRTNYLEKSAPK